MLLGLSKIIDSPGASVPFSTSVDLSDLCYGISYPVTEPVLAEGTVRNTAGVLMMTGEITTCIHNQNYDLVTDNGGAGRRINPYRR